jgi:hypothetical protein
MNKDLAALSKAKAILDFKSYRLPNGDMAIEGWISTPKQDLEKDIMEPEAFSGEGLYKYLQGVSPVSTEHNMKAWPIGHMQKATLVREGHIIQEESNPQHDSIDYLYFDKSRIGWYGALVIDDQVAIDKIEKGKVGSFSWVGMPRMWDEIPGGGRRFSKKGGINPLLEVTITAYPINVDAVMRIAKAHGYPAEPPATKPVTYYSIPKSAISDAVFNSEALRKAVHEALVRNWKE